ncbi:MAG: M23 family metallopeptidase [Spirochaetaceae bacterium]|jgi:murein DD-endopeptidase MepM/ murein hydrolase activator NlpD|nr:M23 family metallopeptidase [Spirochaetaceae bacterium]
MYIKKRELFSNLFFLCAALSLLACITRTGGKTAHTNAAASANTAVVPIDPWTLITEDRAFTVQDEARPGEPVTVILAAANSGMPAASVLKAALWTTDGGGGTSTGKKLSGAVFFEYQIDEAHSVQAAVLSVPSTAQAGNMVIRIEETANGGVPKKTQGANPPRIRAEIPLAVRERSFISEEIPLNPSNTALRTEPDPRKTSESAQLSAILNKSGDTVYINGKFSTPVPAQTRRTSFFGDRRVYVYSNGKRDTAIHAGIDYGVPTGTKVYAPADGRVALARERIVTGNSIVLEHLPGLYTLYYHLDKILVEEGALVTAGSLLAESGSTGLATGPHLHWEIRAGGENTDPDALCSAPLLDRAVITQKLFSGR